MRRRTPWLTLLLAYVVASASLIVMSPPASAEPDPVGPDRIERLATPYRWPLAGSPTVVRHFTPPASRYGRGHRGVDLAGTPGMPVLAAGDGVVAFAGVVAGRGVVSIDHGNGLRTSYEPVAEPRVHIGAAIEAGTVIATLEAGHPGCQVAACLHWGLQLRESLSRRPGSPRRGSHQRRTYLDPLLLFGLGKVRLYPTLVRRRLTAPVSRAAAQWPSRAVGRLALR